uniref:Uncharacterized protein n=1 Tax=Pan paniscus TaxID=9597 RepID=A0A2R9CA47_PANPA
MLYLVCCFLLFNIAVNSGAYCSICFIFLKKFHKKATLILPYFNCK